VREAISDLLEAEDYDDGDTPLLPPFAHVFELHLSWHNAVSRLQLCLALPTVASSYHSLAVTCTLPCRKISPMQARAIRLGPYTNFLRRLNCGSKYLIILWLAFPSSPEGCNKTQKSGGDIDHQIYHVQVRTVLSSCGWHGTQAAPTTRRATLVAATAQP